MASFKAFSRRVKDKAGRVLKDRFGLGRAREGQSAEPLSDEANTWPTNESAVEVSQTDTITTEDENNYSIATGVATDTEDADSMVSDQAASGEAPPLQRYKAEDEQWSSVRLSDSRILDTTQRSDEHVKSPSSAPAQINAESSGAKDKGRQQMSLSHSWNHSRGPSPMDHSVRLSRRSADLSSGRLRSSFSTMHHSEPVSPVAQVGQDPSTSVIIPPLEKSIPDLVSKSDNALCDSESERSEPHALELDPVSTSPSNSSFSGTPYARTISNTDLTDV